MNVEKYLTVPYIDGSRDIAVGLDCWGMARHVLHHEFGLPMFESFGGINRSQPVMMTSGFDESVSDFEECEAPSGGGGVAVFFAVMIVMFFIMWGVCISGHQVLHASSKKGPHVSPVRRI